MRYIFRSWFSLIIVVALIGLGFFAWLYSTFDKSELDAIERAREQVLRNPTDRTAADVLVNGVHSTNLDTRYIAIRAMGDVDSSHVIEAHVLRELFNSSDRHTRREAVLALKGRSDLDHSLIPNLIGLLQEPVAADLPVFAAQVLSEMGAMSKSMFNNPHPG